MKKAFTLAEILMPKRTSGIENKVLYSRESEGQAPSKTNKKLAAFTLAEVLITLAIIGVIAALTVSGIIIKNQKTQYYVQFRRTYNTIITSYQLAVAKNGTFLSWKYNDSDEYKKQMLMDYWLPFLRVVQVCDKNNLPDCGITDDIKIKYLNAPHEQPFEYSGLRQMNGSFTVILEDGSLIDFGFSGVYTNSSIAIRDFKPEIFIRFDTNGPKKGPNIFGRDIFDYLQTSSDGLRLEFLPSDPYSDNEWDNCTTDKKSVGLGCITRLLQEGKMDY